MGMNIFRVLGDVSHYTAIITIFGKIISSKSCKGISGKSQILNLLVFITRYNDIFFNFISWYNTSIKIFFIISSLTNIYLVFVRYKGTISSEMDNFRIEWLIGIATIMSLIINHELAMFEVLWTFSGKYFAYPNKKCHVYVSVYLESVAILPQLTVTNQGKASDIDSVILFYLSALTSHKLLYIVNWIYRYHNEGFYDIISMAAGIIQAAIYVNFFVMFFIKKFAESKIETSV